MFRRGHRDGPGMRPGGFVPGAQDAAPAPDASVFS
jgi:hypothetical protein